MSKTNGRDAHPNATHASGSGPPVAPQRAGLVLATLIRAAVVAKLNMAVADVALPTIGAAFDASQTALDLVAVGHALGPR